MLKMFRDNLKYLSWIIWVVIAVFILFVFVDFGSIRLGGTAPTDAAASVGDQAVTYGEFERTYRQTEDYYRQTLGEQFNRELAQQMGLPLQVLDQLVAEKIVLGEAERMGLRVTDNELAEYIAEIPAFQLTDGRFVGEQRYQEILLSNGYTVEQFEEGARSDLLSQKVRSVLGENLYVSDQEVIDSYKDQVEKAHIRYLRLPSDQLRDAISLSDDEIAAFFSEHKEDFQIPERRTVDYLLVDPQALRSTIDVTDDEIADYYNSNPDDFLQDEQVRARHILLQVNTDRDDEAAQGLMAQIRQRLENGEDFAALAQELSDDPGSKAKGGDLGFFGRGQMIPEFETAAFDAQPGDLVGPIRTSFGYHLIEVLEKRPAGTRSLESATEEIRDMLLTQRSREQAEAMATELAEAAAKGKIDSADALRELAGNRPGVTVKTTAPFGRDDVVEGMGRATAFTAAAFELSPGTLSAVVPVSQGWAILRLNTVEEPRIPDLEEVREEARMALLEERQIEAARKRLEEARLALQDGKTFDEVAAELELAVTDGGEFGRQGSITGLGNNPKIVAAALELDQGAIGGPIVHNRDVVLFEVTERHRYDPLRFEQEKEAARENLRQERLGQMLSSLVAQRRDELGVHYDPQLLQNFEVTVGEG
jgi:peptidyl-prolyl cis-trans isomerase D